MYTREMIAFARQLLKNNPGMSPTQALEIAKNTPPGAMTGELTTGQMPAMEAMTEAAQSGMAGGAQQYLPEAMLRMPPRFTGQLPEGQGSYHMMPNPSLMNMTDEELEEIIRQLSPMKI